MGSVNPPYNGQAGICGCYLDKKKVKIGSMPEERNMNNLAE